MCFAAGQVWSDWRGGQGNVEGQQLVNGLLQKSKYILLIAPYAAVHKPSLCHSPALAKIMPSHHFITPTQVSALCPSLSSCVLPHLPRYPFTELVHVVSSLYDLHHTQERAHSSGKREMAGDKVAATFQSWLAELVAMEISVISILPWVRDEESSNPQMAGDRIKNISDTCWLFHQWLNDEKIK